MGRGALLGWLVKWLGVGLLLGACSRTPEGVPVNERPPSEDVPVATPPVDPARPVPPRDTTWDPISPVPFPGQTPPDAAPDAGSPDGGGVGDGGAVGEVPPPESFPSVACGPAEPEPLAEAPTGMLVAASPGARVLVSHERDGIHWVRHVPSGRLTRFESRWWIGITPDERAVVFLGHAGGLFSLDVATGVARELIPNPNLYVPREPSSPDFVFFHGAYGGAWAYSWRSGQVFNLSSGEGACTPSNGPGAKGRLLASESGAFVLWDTVSGQRWTTPRAKAARLLPDGTGMIYSDDADVLWGWTPERGPVLLGQGAETPRRCLLESDHWQISPAGEVLFFADRGGGKLWTPRTGAMRDLGPDAVHGVLSESGTRLALLHSPPDRSSWVLTVQSLPNGPERVIDRKEGRAGSSFLRLNRDGTRLAFSQLVPGDEGKNWGEQRHQVRLWDLEKDQEVVMTPTPKPLQKWGYAFFFREESDMLYLSNWNTNDMMYSARTGARLFETTRGAVPGVGNYSFWGGNGVFYTPVYDHAGPPDRGLYAWNPQTGVETYLGREMATACVLGEHHLLLSGVPYPEHPTPGTLLVWNSTTGRSQTVATRVMHSFCVPGRRAATFFTEPKDGAPAAGASTPPAPTLNFIDVARGCQQPLATEVEQTLPVDGGVVFHAKGKVWRVRLP